MRECTKREIKKWYQAIDDADFRKAYYILSDRLVYVLTEHGRFWTDGEQLKGVHVFTDRWRATEYLAKDKNAGLHVKIEKAIFRDIYLRCAFGSDDLIVNITPFGSPYPFVRYAYKEDRWYLTTKRPGTYELPYGLTSHPDTWAGAIPVH